MAEKKAQKIKMQSDYLSDSKSSEDEAKPHLQTSQEERVYGTIKGSTQSTRQRCLTPLCSVTQWWKEDHQSNLR